MCFIFFIFISRRLYNFGICSVSTWCTFIVVSKLLHPTVLRLLIISTQKINMTSWPPPPFFYIYIKKMVFVYTVVQSKKIPCDDPRWVFFLIVAYFEKVKIIYVKIFFIFSYDRKEIICVFFYCFEFQDKIFLIKTNGLSVQIAQTCHSRQMN